MFGCERKKLERIGPVSVIFNAFKRESFKCALMVLALV